MKRDLNYLRHIKPQIREKEKADKQDSRERRYHAARVAAGVPEAGLTLEDVGIITPLLRTVHRWTAHGGFANRGKGKGPGSENRKKEALFFSPHCFSSGLKRFESPATTETGTEAEA